VSEGGPPVSNENLTVELQPGGMDYNGTRIVSKSGQLLLPEDIDVPLPVQVDGTAQAVSGADPILRAALVIVDRSAVNAEQVSGVILSVASGYLVINPEAATVCGVATESLQVDLAGNTDFLTVTITEDGSVIEPGGIPEPDQTVGINGNCKVGGYETDNVVIVDDQRT